MLNKEKTNQLADCDIFVFPTFYPNECFPIVLLEAMQQGKPIVTSAEGGIPDIVLDGENGYSIDNPTPQDIADKIENLFKDRILSKHMGKVSLKLYKENFNLKTYENRIMKILVE